MNIYLSPETRRGVRLAANASRSNIPVVVVEGAKPPVEVGSPGYHTNARGDVIRHPNAYRSAWGKPIYHPSTVRVEVGVEWLVARGLALSPSPDVDEKVLQSV